MVESEYKDRLEEAMTDAGVSVQALADHLKISYQAVKKVLGGSSAAFTAANSARTADFLGVDHFWLATGEGKKRPDRAWPFELFMPDEYKLLPQKERVDVENSLAGAIQRLKQSKAA